MPLVSRPNRDGSGYLMHRARRVFSPLAGRPGQEQEHDSRDLSSIAVELLNMLAPERLGLRIGSLVGTQNPYR